MPVILQINFKLDITDEELAERSNAERAKIFWSVPGLRWKIWLRESDNRISGGIYLFDNRAAAEAYANGPIGDAVKALPDSSDHSFKFFDIREEVSAITGAPLDAVMNRG